LSHGMARVTRRRAARPGIPQPGPNDEPPARSGQYERRGLNEGKSAGRVSPRTSRGEQVRAAFQRHRSGQTVPMIGQRQGPLRAYTQRGQASTPPVHFPAQRLNRGVLRSGALAVDSIIERGPGQLSRHCAAFAELNAVRVPLDKVLSAHYPGAGDRRAGDTSPMAARWRNPLRRTSRTLALSPRRRGLMASGRKAVIKPGPHRPREPGPDRPLAGGPRPVYEFTHSAGDLAVQA